MVVLSHINAPRITAVLSSYRRELGAGSEVDNYRTTTI